MKTTEAQREASKKYRLAHKEYYSRKSNEYFKKVRQDRDKYKERIDKAIEYMKANEFININDYWKVAEFYKNLFSILQGENNE